MKRKLLRVCVKDILLHLIIFLWDECHHIYDRACNLNVEFFSGKEMIHCCECSLFYFNMAVVNSTHFSAVLHSAVTLQKVSSLFLFNICRFLLYFRSLILVGPDNKRIQSHKRMHKG